MDRVEKILDTISILLTIIVIVGFIWFVNAFKEMLNECRCLQLSISDFYQDESCKKYWKYR